MAVFERDRQPAEMCGRSYHACDASEVLQQLGSSPDGLAAREAANRLEFTWQGAFGTPPVLIAITVVVVAQFAFTYLPVMQDLFASRAISLVDGLLIIGIGVVAMVILETEKHLMRRLGVLKTYA